MTAGSFTTPRDAARDLELPLDTRGLLWWLASHSTAYVARLDEARIMHAVGAKRDAVRRMLRQLVDAGYLVRTRLRAAGGQLLAGVRYALNMRPDRALLDRAACDGNPVVSPEQPKQGVSAGGTNDGNPVAGTSYREDTVREEEGALSVTHAREHDPEPTPQSGVSMPSYRQTRLPIITPRKAGKDDIEPTSPGTLVQITPQAQALALMRRLTTTITDEWLSRCQRRPPAVVIDGAEAQIYALVAEGIPDDDIRRGMAAWMVKGYAPGAIPSFVNQAMNARPLDAHMAQPTRRDLRAAAAVAIGERLQAEADTRAS